jgi:hypothetical protein
MSWTMWNSTDNGKINVLNNVKCNWKWKNRFVVKNMKFYWKWKNFSWTMKFYRKWKNWCLEQCEILPKMEKLGWFEQYEILPKVEKLVCLEQFLILLKRKNLFVLMKMKFYRIWKNWSWTIWSSVIDIGLSLFNPITKLYSWMI